MASPAPPGAAPAVLRRRAETERPDRRQAILLAAEKLFAMHGYHAVTIRRIAEEAGVPLALVGYYFGAKHELFHAIFAHWSTSIDERLAALREVDASRPGPKALRQIIEAFTGPVIRLRASVEGEYYALLVARELYHATPEADRVLRGYFDPLAHAFIDALNRQFPQASRGRVAWAYQFTLGALLHHLSDNRVERLSHGECRPGDAAGSAMLVDFVVGGLLAVLSPSAPPRRAAPASPQNTRRPRP